MLGHCDVTNTHIEQSYYKTSVTVWKTQRNNYSLEWAQSDGAGSHLILTLFFVSTGCKKIFRVMQNDVQGHVTEIKVKH